MANTKQAKKMIRKTEKLTQHNRWWKSRVKDAIKRVKDGEKDAMTMLQKTVDKAVKSDVLHKNKGSRIKSSMSRILQYKKN